MMISSTHQPETDTSDNLSSPLTSEIRSEEPTLTLIRKLCGALFEENIQYCHWKSNNAIARSASGENDLDLLVSRTDIPRFTRLLYRFGFKKANTSSEKQMPGVLDYYGYDEESGRLVHVHAHFQLVLGHDMTKNYRLPLERAYMESSVQEDVFKLPAPEYEFIVFVIRMILKHVTWDTILGGEGKLNQAERRELEYLNARSNDERVRDILIDQLPYIDLKLFEDCRRALDPDCPAWTRIKVGQRLQAQLKANARRSYLVDTFLKLWRRAVLVIRRRTFKVISKRRFEGGGAIIALVGGDGAGKSTAVDGLHAWLSKELDTMKVHLGKPAWSRFTIFVRGILKIGQFFGLYPLETTFQETINQKSRISPGYPFLIREVCRARDRFGVYLKARRFADKGGLVILDRFPLPQVQLMDGPQNRRFIRALAAGPRANQWMAPRPNRRFAQALVNIEENIYRKIVRPELLIVLLVDPEIAVQRKTDEDSNSVRVRSSEIYGINWEATDVHIVDASKSKAEVLSELKTILWSRL